MPDPAPEYRTLVVSKRFIAPGVMDTFSDLAPLVDDAMGKITADLGARLDELDGGGWTIVSHSLAFYSGLMIVTFLLKR